MPTEVPVSGFPPPAPDELVSVVVCTLGRQASLRETVQAVLSQTHPHIDLVVVDNAPSTGRTRALLRDMDDPRLRVVAEPVPGLSAARNAGLASVAGGLVAFTDDDAVPDPTWLTALLDVLRGDHAGVVTCVTGRVVAAETATVEQEWFEVTGAFDKGTRRTVWSLATVPAEGLGTPGERTIFFPYTAGEMGTGNNMVFRTDALRALAGFDEALGAGSPAKGGEDLDIFRRIVLAGQVLVYTPDAVVRHHHRDTYQALRNQLFGYGVGMSAGLSKVVAHGGRPALGVLRCLPAGVRTLLSPASTKNVKIADDMPRALVLTELLGYAAGPFLYLYSAVRARYLRTVWARRSAADGSSTPFRGS